MRERHGVSRVVKIPRLKLRYTDIWYRCSKGHTYSYKWKTNVNKS